MPKLNPFEEAAIRSADRTAALEAEAEKSRAVPFGEMKMSDMDGWRRHWESAPKEQKRQMFETLGETTRERTREYMRRMKR